MKWTKPLLDMIKQADVIEDGKYVLSINRNGDKPSDALKQLRDKLVAESGNEELTCRAVWQQRKKLMSAKRLSEEDGAAPTPGAQTKRVREQSGEEEDSYTAKRAHQEVEDSEHVFSTRDEQRAAARIQKRADLQTPGVVNIGPWDDVDIAKVVEWTSAHKDDRSSRSDLSDALVKMATELKRTPRGMLDKVLKVRKQMPQAAEQVVASEQEVVDSEQEAQEVVAPAEEFDAQAAAEFMAPAEEEVVHSEQEAQEVMAQAAEEEAAEVVRAVAVESQYYDEVEADTYVQDLLERMRARIGAAATDTPVNHETPSNDWQSMYTAKELFEIDERVERDKRERDKRDDDESEDGESEDDESDDDESEDGESDDDESEDSESEDDESDDDESDYDLNKIREMISASNGAAAAPAPVPQALMPFSYGETIMALIRQQVDKADEAGAAAGSSNGAAAAPAPVPQALVPFSLVELESMVESDEGAAATVAPVPQALMLMAFMRQQVDEAYQAGVAAGSSSGAAATATATPARLTTQDTRLVESLAAVAGSRLREMSPSNGAAAAGTPVRHTLLRVEAMNLDHVQRIFEGKVKGKSVPRLQAMLQALWDMVNDGVIKVSGAEDSNVFGISHIEVRNQHQWHERMTRAEITCTTQHMLKSKKYHVAIYNLLSGLGFSGREPDKGVFRALGRPKKHICFRHWTYSKKVFLFKRYHFFGHEKKK